MRIDDTAFRRNDLERAYGTVIELNVVTDSQGGEKPQVTHGIGVWQGAVNVTDGLWITI